MTNNKTRNKIARIAMEPIVNRLTQRATEEMAETFCKSRCGHGPGGDFCDEARIIYNCLLLELFKCYRSNN